MKRFGLAIVLGLLAASPSRAITLDGSTAGDSYTLASTQTVETGFGDNQSELDAAWVKIEGGTLHMVFTGNLHDFNKLTIFFDSKVGGQNVIGPDASNGGTNPPNDNWASELSGVGPNTPTEPPGPGLTFDAGFAADYMFLARRDGGNTQFDVDFAVVGGGAAAFQSAGDIFGATAQGAAPNILPTYGISVGADNSNAAGVLGGGSAAANAAAAQAVLTGVELSIPLATLGNPSSIKISAFINGSNNDYVSNQILGGLTAPQGNLGGDNAGNFRNDVSFVNFATLSGDQFFTVQIPEPATALLFGLAGLGLATARRRRAA